MRFPQIPESLSELSDDELTQLHDELVAAFNEATAEGVTISDEDVAELTGVTESIEKLRGEQTTRVEAAVAAEAEAAAAEAARAEQLADLASRVNAAVDDDAIETETEENADESETPAETEVPDESETPTEEVETPETQAEPVAVAATGTKAKAVTAGASVAQLKRNAPARTRPRAEAPEQTSVTITAAVDVPGLAPGQKLNNLRQVAEAMCERYRTIGTGNGDSVQVARFSANVPEERRLTRDMSADQIAARLQSFNRSPQGITAAGGLCAPVDGYYDQLIVADADRPVRDALANFQADRGGIRYNPPPKLSSLTSGVGTVTVAQDASNATKTAFAVTCQSAVEVDVVAIYTSLLFGNIGSRAFPESVEAWIKLGLAAAARKAETVLLDAISAGSTPVTTAGLVGAGREVFARLGQVAAGYRSRNRMKADAPLRLLLPAWTLDLVQADFARTFTDETGLISVADTDVANLFGVRGLNVSWYLDSKTGGGQIFGAAAGGQTYTDAATTNASATLTSATATFTLADVGKTITGAGIPASTTISAVGSGTSITLSANATATATGVTIVVGRTTAAQFPTTVDAFLFPEGSWLHLDAGTLDLGLVRDSTLNANNQFSMFSETFENAALVGPESLEVILSLSPDGSYAAAKSVTSPINS